MEQGLADYCDVISRSAIMTTKPTGEHTPIEHHAPNSSCLSLSVSPEPHIPDTFSPLSLPQVHPAVMLYSTNCIIGSLTSCKSLWLNACSVTNMQIKTTSCINWKPMLTLRKLLICCYCAWWFNFCYAN